MDLEPHTHTDAAGATGDAHASMTGTHSEQAAAGSSSGMHNQQQQEGAAAPSSSGSAVPSVDTSAAAAAASAAAPVPFVMPKPILRGRIIAAQGAQKPNTFSFEGMWAVTEADIITSEFRYTFTAPASAGMPLPPPGVQPLHPSLPSAPDHHMAAPMSGYYLFKDKPEPAPPSRIQERSVTLRIGGPVPAEAPAGMTLPDGSTPAASQLVGITGEGQQPLGKFQLAGVYHPATGTAWLKKIFQPRVLGAKSPAPKAAGGSSGSLASSARRGEGGSSTPGAAAAEGGAAAAGGAGGASAVSGPPAKSSKQVYEEVKLRQSVRKPTTKEMRDCMEILATVRRDRSNSWYFLKPVDPVQDKCPDYYNVVSSPMDLTTVRAKAESNQYANHEEFAADMRLTFDNALKYNGPMHPVGKAAEALKLAFEQEYAQYLQLRRDREAAGQDPNGEDDDKAGISLPVSTTGKRAAALSGSKRNKPLGDGESGGEGLTDEESDGGGGSVAAAAAAQAAKKKKAKKSGGGGAAAGGVAGISAALSALTGASAGGGGGGGGGGATGSEAETAALRKQVASLSEQLKMLVEATSVIAKATAAGMTGGLPLANLQALGGGGGGGGAGGAGRPMPAAMPAPAAAPSAKKQAPRGAAAKAVEAKKKAGAAAAGGGAGGAGRAGSAYAAPAAGMSTPAPSSSSSAGALRGAAFAAELTYEEKSQLSEDVGQLSAEQVEGVINIIKERTSIGDSIGGEVELDIDALDTQTLRMLQKYIAKCLGREPPAAAAAAGGGGGAGGALPGLGRAPSSAGFPVPAAAAVAAPAAAAGKAAASAAAVAERNLQRIASMSTLGMGGVAGGPGAAAGGGGGTAIGTMLGGAGGGGESEDEDLPPPPSM